MPATYDAAVSAPDREGSPTGAAALPERPRPPTTVATPQERPRSPTTVAPAPVAGRQGRGLRGRVVLGPAGDPVSGLEVVLHRIGEDAGPAARDTTDARGRFAFPPPAASGGGAAGAIFVATVRYGGVLYHGPPVSASGSVPRQVLRVYEPHPVDSVSVGARHAVLRPLREGAEVIDAYLLAAPGDRARVPPDPAAPGWRLPLPPGAADVRLRLEGSGAGGARVEDGGLRVTGAVPPGGRTIVAEYRLSGSELRLPLLPSPGRFDVLIAAGAGRVEVDGATPAGTADLDGQAYRRFVREAGPAAAGEPGGRGAVVIRFGADSRAAWAWAFLAAGLLFAAGAVVAGRSLRSGSPRP